MNTLLVESLRGPTVVFQIGLDSDAYCEGQI